MGADGKNLHTPCRGTMPRCCTLRARRDMLQGRAACPSRKEKQKYYSYEQPYRTSFRISDPPYPVDSRPHVSVAPGRLHLAIRRRDGFTSWLIAPSRDAEIEFIIRQLCYGASAAACLQPLNRIQPDDNRTGPVTFEGASGPQRDAVGDGVPVKTRYLRTRPQLAANKSSGASRRLLQIRRGSVWHRVRVRRT